MKWVIIKRQTELGEHHGFEDEAFSSLGPITEYHATNALPEVLSDEKGINPPPYKRSSRYIPKNLRREFNQLPQNKRQLTYTTPDLSFAEAFRDKRINEQGPGTRTNIPREDFGIVAVRGRDLPKPEIEDSHPLAQARLGNIPRKYLVRKEAKSPAAIEHKRKYETEYESSPARKKYRRELERERRKRGVAGKGGKDMSHTKDGRIVPEDPHTNRARSHPSVGSTLKMVVVKAPQMNLGGYSAQCELCNAMVDSEMADYTNQIAGETLCPQCVEKEINAIHAENEVQMHRSEPMEITMRLLKEQTRLFIQGQKTLDGQPAFAPTDFSAIQEQQRKKQEEQRKKEERVKAMKRQAIKAGMTIPLQDFPPSSE